MGCVMRWAWVLALVVAWPVGAKQPRSAAAKYWFVKLHACPATGAHRVPCPGYVIDHVVPLCAGGEDAPANMQWQTVDEARGKDREEQRTCRALRAQPARGEGSGFGGDGR